MEEVISIHEQMIDAFGGRYPIHDFAMLHSALSRPQATFAGKDLYETIFEKATALLHSMILNHPFDDGNKRTAITTCAYFLYKNGWDLSLPFKESAQFTLDIDHKTINFEETTKWIERHSEKIA